jgi:hypothetical protein
VTKEMSKIKKFLFAEQELLYCATLVLRLMQSVVLCGPSGLKN